MLTHHRQRKPYVSNGLWPRDIEFFAFHYARGIRIRDASGTDLGRAFVHPSERYGHYVGASLHRERLREQNDIATAPRRSREFRFNDPQSMTWGEGGRERRASDAVGMADTGRSMVDAPSPMIHGEATREARAPSDRV